ncbi:Uncharacterized protein C8034_v009494 [Colletotrichum sidae]|uniref:Hydantoin racemase n=1 Tax=Colletotrichum sidae TaxID=1347389 RepID=A0A4R8TJQ9_9PEZI|nr:Uncharacterized protein C8034_v009494 [Colletotrichum sidae]
MSIRILCIIPISTTHMTDDLARLYPSTPGLDVTFVDGRGLPGCPPCIENDVQAVESTAAVLPRAVEYIDSHDVDGVLVCCFSNHPLVHALREVCSLPVTGIVQAALHDAVRDGASSFGIVTTAHAWEEVLAASVGDLGYGGSSAGVAATGLGVLELESLDRRVVVERILVCTRRLVDNGATGVILGCAGMAALEQDIRQRLPPGTRTIDGVRSGIDMLAGLTNKHLATNTMTNTSGISETKPGCSIKSRELTSLLEKVC